jgi:hypothetical protein
MLSTSKSFARALLLTAAVALPLSGGAVFAQTTQTVPSAPAVTTAPAATTSKVQGDKVQADKGVTDKTQSDKQIGALKATPAEKKAMHDKSSAADPAHKTSLVKHVHAVKKVPAAASGASDAAKSAPVAK